MRTDWSETLTRQALTEALIRETGLNKAESSQLVEMILEEIAGALARGEPVKIKSFGSFHTRDKPPRTGRNPKTGIEAPISARRVVAFRPSGKLRQHINEFRRRDRASPQR